MQRHKVFELFEDLIGDAAYIASHEVSADSYIRAGINSLEAVSKIISFLIELSNNRKLIKNSEKEAAEKIKTFREENKKELEKIKHEFDMRRQTHANESEKYREVRELIFRVGSRLKKTIDFVDKIVESFDTEELVNTHKKEIADLQEWRRKSMSNYKNLLNLYQGGE